MRVTRRTAGTILSALLWAGCRTGSADDLSAELSKAAVSRKDITASVAATGTVEPIRVIDVKSQASGEVLLVGVELGAKVERGELLVSIDPRDVKNAHEQAAADLEVAQARFTISERQLRRTTLLRDSAVVTEEELESAILEQANAKAAIVKARTNLELAEDRLRDVNVRAPLPGTVVEKNVEEGQIVTSTREVTGGTVLLRMADLSEVQVRTLVDETDIGKIQPGLTATIRVEAYPERTFTGKVLQVEPQAVVEQGVTLFAVLTRIRNDEDLLRPGMSADVEVVVGERSDVLSLPNGAIKMPEAAQQLVEALGMDPAVLRTPTELGAEAGNRGSDEVGDPEGDAGEADASTPSDGLPGMQQIQAMSREERAKLFEKLSPGQRQRLFQQFREARERRQAEERANPGSPRPAFVFVVDEEGLLTLKPVTIGLSTWEETEIIAGLEEGETVVEIPLSLIQQQQFLDRIRSFSRIPGISRS